MMIDRAIGVILGGGVGSRLYPLTQHRSKPAVPIGGKYRLIDIPISNCLNSQLRRIFVLTQFNSASLNRHIRNAYHFDIFSKGFVDILAAEQTHSNANWFLGTADAVRQSLPHLDNHEHDYVVILSGDQLYQMDFSAMLKHHINNDADLTIATIPVNAKDATGFGIMKVDDKDTIVDFVEKPGMDVLGNWKSPLDDKFKKEGKDYLASMGIYIFNRSAMMDLMNKMPDAMDFGKEIIPHAVHSEDYNVCSYPFGGYWTDIGSISSYFAANLYLTQYLPEFNLYDNYNPVYSNARMLSPSKFFGTRLIHALVSDGCIVHADIIEHCIIGIRSRIGAGTVISRAIIAGNDYYQSLRDISAEQQHKLLGIGKDCLLRNCIVDKNVKIGNNVSIIGDSSLADTETPLYCIRDGIIIIKKDVTIPDFTKIGLAKKD